MSLYSEEALLFSVVYSLFIPFLLLSVLLADTSCLELGQLLHFINQEDMMRCALINQSRPKFELCFCLALLTPCITFPDRFLITFLILNNLFCWLVTTTEFQLFNHPSQILNLSQTKHSKHKMNFNQFNSVQHQTNFQCQVSQCENYLPITWFLHVSVRFIGLITSK